MFKFLLIVRIFVGIWFKVIFRLLIVFWILKEVRLYFFKFWGLVVRINVFKLFWLMGGKICFVGVLRLIEK